MFNCTSCGPIEIAIVHGDWVGPDLHNVIFEVTRPSGTDYSAVIQEGSRYLLERGKVPKALADVENYCEETRKFQCPTCGTTFGIPRPVSTDPAAAAMAAIFNNTNPAMGFTPPSGPAMQGLNFSVLVNEFSVLSQTSCEVILRELGEDPANFSTHMEMVEAIVEHLQ